MILKCVEILPVRHEKISIREVIVKSSYLFRSLYSCTIQLSQVMGDDEDTKYLLYAFGSYKMPSGACSTYSTGSYSKDIFMINHK